MSSAAQELTTRVRRMELYFDTLRRAVQEDAEFLREPPLQAMLDALTAYCDSGQWLSDYEADERGELPLDLRRGVLSEDGVYDLFCEIREIRERETS